MHTDIVGTLSNLALSYLSNINTRLTHLLVVAEVSAPELSRAKWEGQRPVYNGDEERVQQAAVRG